MARPPLAIEQQRQPGVMMIRGLLTAGAVAAGVFAGAAHADVMVNIRTYWSATLFERNQSGPVVAPQGLSITCGGTASSAGLGCQDSAGIFATAATPAILGTNRTGQLVLTNNGALVLDLEFRTDYSAFNPGGPEIGISVTDSAVELAGFSSSVFGPGVGDAHSCRTTPTQRACGVGSPDSSQGGFLVTGLASGETRTLAFNSTISVQAVRVSEPGILPLLALGAFGVAASMQRRKSQ